MKLADAFEVKTREVVAFVGAGGKTSAMYRLAAEYVDRGKTVVMTTTTKMYESDCRRSDEIIISDDPTWLKTELFRRIRPGKIICIGSGHATTTKVRGVEPSLVDELARSGKLDLVVVKADGAAEKSIKAPRENEPVIPCSATLVVPVAGLDALEKPLTSEYAHRPAMISKLTGLKIGDPITKEAMAILLSHEDANAKGAPPNAKIVPLINKVESDKDLREAQTIARLILAYAGGMIHRVVVGHVQRDDPVIRIIKA